MDMPPNPATSYSRLRIGRVGVAAADHAFSAPAVEPDPPPSYSRFETQSDSDDVRVSSGPDLVSKTKPS
jgi:hypothetical protein